MRPISPRILSLAVGVALTAAMLVPEAVAAATPAAVTINESEIGVGFALKSPGLGRDAFYVEAAGTATATGATLAATFAESDLTMLTNGPNLFAVQTLSNAGGTITIDVTARIVAGDTNEFVLGNWSIVDGTGAYIGLHGTGAYTATVCHVCQPHTIDGTLSGSAFFDAGS